MLQFDMDRLKWAGVDLLAARRGEGDPEVAQRFGLDRPAHVSHADFILNRMVTPAWSRPILNVACRSCERERERGREKGLERKL